MKPIECLILACLAFMLFGVLQPADIGAEPTLATMTPPDPCPCPEDVNRDGCIDITDVMDLLVKWNPFQHKGKPVDCPTKYIPDTNGDKRVDGADLVNVLSAWGVCE